MSQSSSSRAPVPAPPPAAAPVPVLRSDLGDYERLVTAQHNQQPRFMATVGLSVQPYVDLQNQLFPLPHEFDVDYAVGEQLDFTGQWIGLTRYIAIPRTDFMTWDSADPTQGWDSGHWSGPYAEDLYYVSLNDEYYRFVLKGRIAANNWDGTKEGAYAAWQTVFGPLGYQVLIQENFDKLVDWLRFDDAFSGWDNTYWDQTDLAHRGRCTGNMHMLLALVGPPPDPVLEALFSGGYFDLKPAGVGMGYLTTQSGDGSPDGYPLFGWDMGDEFPDTRELWFSFDDGALGWDIAKWYPRELYSWFTWDGSSLEGWDNGVWYYLAGAPLYLTWDDAIQGWDYSQWAPVTLRPQLFALDDPTGFAGLDYGIWAPISGAFVQSMPATPAPLVVSVPAAAVVYALPRATPLLIEGWDIGAWAREIQTIRRAA